MGDDQHNAVLIQHCTEPLFAQTIALYYGRNVEYCIRHNMDYWCIAGLPHTLYQTDNDPWARIGLVQAACHAGYKYIAYWDTDTLVIDMAADWRDACKTAINMTWWEVPLGHLQGGAVYWNNTNGAALDLVNVLLQEKKYFLKRYPYLRGWFEQGQINEFYANPMTQPLFTRLDMRWNWGDICGERPTDLFLQAWHGEPDQNKKYELIESSLHNLEANHG